MFLYLFGRRDKLNIDKSPLMRTIIHSDSEPRNWGGMGSWDFWRI